MPGLCVVDEPRVGQGSTISMPPVPSCGQMVTRRHGLGYRIGARKPALLLAPIGGPGQGCGSTHPPTGSKPAMASRGPQVPGL